MPPSKSSFVTACQQVLALGLVLAVLTPAASVVSLDVVRESPGRHTAPSLEAGLAAYARESGRASQVPAEVVDPSVAEYALTPAAGSKAAIGGVHARTKAGALGGTEVTSIPEPVVGYGAVGVTWQHGVSVPEDRISVQVRTRTGEDWSEWMDLEYHAEHGPDPDSEEGQRSRPGTDPLLVGEVDQVQVRAESDGDLPPDMRLAVVDPGTAARTAVERPALDTATTGDDAGASAPTQPADAADGADADGLDLRAATFTPKPQIFSRAQWGADERMREKSSLHYFEVHAGFVHHTVNANDYSRAEVPGIIRSIYAYHTQSRGWSDIGYNFLVDRFGRIWEGRYGGIDRPVVGAHTLDYNDYAFAMSAIGNFDVKQPSEAMVEAYGALFAWKLSLHGVDASSTKQWVGSRNFAAINGHRDAASTACPGRYLYARIPRIRTLAADAQRGWAGRELESDLASTPYPDLIVRRASDGQGFIIPTGGLTGFRPAATAATGLASNDTVVASPDLTGDGLGDLVVRSADGTARVRPGTKAGVFGEPVKQTGAFADHDLLTAVGDLNGDGRNDLVARRPDSGRLDAYLGRGDGTFKVVRHGTGWGDYNLLAGAGDLHGDGHTDLLARDAAGALWLHPGRGDGFGKPVRVPGRWKQYAAITGYGDFNGDGRTDVFAREAATGNGFVVPSQGDGTFGRRLGPVTRVKGVGALAGATQLVGDQTPDLVARAGDRLVVFGNAGTTETRAPIATGVNLSGANLVLNAGDWDRDGSGDIISRSKKNGALYLRSGDGTGHFAPARKIGGGFGGVQLLAAVGDMTGDGFPDLMGQPRGGSMRIYPGNGLAGLRPSYVAHGPIAAGRQVPVGRWDTDGAPDSLFRSGSRLTLFPGNGPGGLTRPRSLGLDLTPYDWVVGVSDVTLTGHSDLIVRARGKGTLWVIQGTAKGFQPRRFLAGGMDAYDLAGGDLLVRPRSREAGRGALGVVRRVQPPRLGVGDQDQRAAPRERLGEGGDPRWGRRVRLREEAAAVGDEPPRGGRPPELTLGRGAVGPGDGRVVRGRRVPGGERVRLRPHLDPHVVDARRERVDEPHAQRQQGAREHGDLVGTIRPALQRARPAHDGVGVRVLGPGDDESDAPGRPEEHRSQPVGGQVHGQGLPTLDAVLIGEQARGLRDPVRVRRHRQLDALPGGVVVEGDQRACGLGPQPASQDLGERRHAPRLSCHGSDRPLLGRDPGRRRRHPAVAALAGLGAEVPPRPHRLGPHAAAGHRRPAVAPGRRPVRGGDRGGAPRRGPRAAARARPRRPPHRARAPRLHGRDRPGRGGAGAHRPRGGDGLLRRRPRDPRPGDVRGDGARGGGGRPRRLAGDARHRAGVPVLGVRLHPPR